MIYLDYNATTPVEPAVFEAMRPFLTERWGNPSSTYRFGAEIRAAIEGARVSVAKLVGCSSHEITFTSGGTEANNLALHAAIASLPAKRHLITTAVEHPSVIAFCQFMERTGYDVTYLGVDSDGLLDLDELSDAIRPDTAVVSIMWANNETGVLFPVHEVAALCQSVGVLFHCDGSQVAGKIPMEVKSLGADYVTITGHKFGAPKGIGAIYIRKHAPFTPLFYGGHQEHERRGGTEPVPLIVALGEAAKLAFEPAHSFSQVVTPLRDDLETQLLSLVPSSIRNGHPVQRLANTSNISFEGANSEAMLLLLDRAGVCASSGSACLAASGVPSHVIEAMKPGSFANSAIRFSLGPRTTTDEVRLAIAAVVEVRAKLAPPKTQPSGRQRPPN